VIFVETHERRSVRVSLGDALPSLKRQGTTEEHHMTKTNPNRHRAALSYIEAVNDQLLDLVAPIECLSSFEAVSPDELEALKKCTSDLLSVVTILRSVQSYHERKQRASSIVVTTSSQDIARERRTRAGGR